MGTKDDHALIKQKSRTQRQVQIQLNLETREHRTSGGTGAPISRLVTFCHNCALSNNLALKNYLDGFNFFFNDHEIPKSMAEVWCDKDSVIKKGPICAAPLA